MHGDGDRTKKRRPVSPRGVGEARTAKGAKSGEEQGRATMDRATGPSPRPRGVGVGAAGGVAARRKKKVRGQNAPAKEEEREPKWAEREVGSVTRNEGWPSAGE